LSTAEQKYSEESHSDFQGVHAIHSKTENYLGKTEIFTPVSLLHLLNILSEKSRKPSEMFQIIFLVTSVLQKV
jgi:hypothetical protein